MPRRDIVPREYVARHVQAWLRDAGNSPTELARRADVHPDTIGKIAKESRNNVPFDTADRLLCAIGQPGLWYQDPDLAGVYQQACQGADAIASVRGLSASEQAAERMRWFREANPPEPIFRNCEECSRPFRVGRQQGSKRYCSETCRKKKYYVKTEHADKACELCGKVFTPKRKDSLYCCSRHQITGKQRERRATAKVAA